jgi:hypothetical protein
MTTDLVTYVDATFGGKAVRFELDRTTMIPALESSLNGGAYECLNRLIRGAWQLRDIQLVLSAAIEIEHAEFISVLNRRPPIMGISFPVQSSPAVVRVLNDNAPARYAVLAMKVLEAALFGIAKEQASFDENAAAEVST